MVSRRGASVDVAWSAAVLAGGLVLAWIVAAMVDIPVHDRIVLISTSFGVALASWFVSAVACSISERAVGSSLNGPRLRAVLIGLTPPVSLAVGAWMAARSMFVSSHDLAALSVVICGAGAVGIAATLRLVGQLEQREAALVASHQRQSALEDSRRELVAWVSHDLRTPIAGMRMMAEALSDGVVTEPQEVQGYHERIQSEAERLARLVDDLFELSRLQVGQLSLTTDVVSLGDLVSDAIASAAPLAATRGVSLDGEVAGNAPRVDVASPEMLRVVHNLLENAVRHTPTGGGVRVAVETLDGLAQFTVSDGCGGIPESEIGRVFEPAYRGDVARSSPGSGGGLGLAIAQGLVEAHGGSIAVANADGGCRFTVRLPLA